MKDDPFTVFTRGDCNRFHEPVAFAGSISWNVVDVDAPQAVWAMVAVVGPKCGFLEGFGTVGTGEMRFHGIIYKKVFLEERGITRVMSCKDSPQEPLEACISRGESKSHK